MEKNEIYEHLAKIYFDKKSPPKNKRALKWKTVLIFLIPAVVITASLFFIFKRGRAVKIVSPDFYALSLATGSNLIKINYNFNKSSFQQEGYTLTLPVLNVENFKILQFNARRLNNKSTLNLKIEMENSFKEIASVYLKGISDKWAPYKIDLKDFKGISFWDTISRISFVAEEWNAEKKNDIVYIEDIRFVK